MVKIKFNRGLIFLIILFTLILSISYASASEDISLADSANLDEGALSSQEVTDAGIETDIYSQNTQTSSYINSNSSKNNINSGDLDSNIYSDSQKEDDSNIYSDSQKEDDSNIYSDSQKEDIKSNANEEKQLKNSKLGQVIRVDHTGNDALDIQNAISLTSNGDIVYLDEYTYNIQYAQINITKNITLRGAGNNTIIYGYGYAAGTEGNSSYGSMLYLGNGASGAKIEGIKFSNLYPNLEYTDWDTLYGWALVISAYARNCTVSNCSFLNFNHGVTAYGSGTVIAENYFTGAATRIMQTKVSGSGNERGTKCIQINDTDNCVIKNNVFYGPVLDAVLLNYDCMNTKITDNKFIGNAYSIYLYGGNTYTYSDSFSRGTVIANNTFTNCGRFDGNMGIYKISFSNLGIIDGEQTILSDIKIIDNIFNLNENSTVINTFYYDYYMDPLCVKGNINVSNNQFNLLNDSLDGNSIVIFRYNEGLLNEMDLEKDIVFINNTFADYMLTAGFLNYDSYSYEYWLSNFGDLIIPASGTYTRTEIYADSEIYVGDDNLITMRFTDANSNNLDGNLTLLIMGEESVESHQINLTNGEARYRLSNLKEGFYYIGVGFGGNSTHYSSYSIQGLNVSCKDTNLNIALSKMNKIFIDENITLRVTLLDEDSMPLNGTVEIKLKDNVLYANTTNGVCDLKLELASLLNETGTYTIEAKYNGTDKYNPSNITLSFNVLSRTTYLSILAPESIISGNPFNITLSLTDFNRNPLNGTVDLIIGNELTKVYINEGTAIVNKVLVEKGNYTIEANFNDAEYGYSYASGNIEVLGKPTDLSLTVSNIEDITYNVSLTLSSSNNPLSGAVAINLDDKIYKVIYVENGKASFIMNDITSNGNHILNAKYYGDNIYAGSDDSKQFTIRFNNDTTIKVNHTGNDLLDLQNTIDKANPDDIINLENYVFSDISNLNVTKDITIISDGATIFSAGDNKPIFNVLSDNITVNISSLNFLLNNNDTVVCLNDSNIENVLFVLTNNSLDKSSSKVNSESISFLYINKELNDAFDGGIVIKDNTLLSRMNLISLLKNNSTDDKNDTNGSSNETVPNETVPRKATKIIFNNMTTKSVSGVDGRVGEYFTYKLTDSEGNALSNKLVQIGFNGHVYDKITDENGEANLQINLGKKGAYTFAMCFLGDDEYNASFEVARIDVETQSPKLTAPAKTYKASAKTKTLTATFKSAYGNVVSGRKISFTVNGKTYTATTNANGVASVKVSLSTKKTYSFTAKFAGDNIFSACTISSKVTIK